MSIIRPTNCEVCGNLLTGRQLRFCSDKCALVQRRWTWIKKVYGLTPEEYDAILAAQGDRCAICQRLFVATPHIDHEHGGHVRGLLCGYCNTRLVGRLKNHETAQRLADYLREPPAVTALGRAVVAPGRPRRKRGKRRG